MNTDNLKKEIKKVKVWHVALLCAGVFVAFAIIGTILIGVGGGWNSLGNIHFGDFNYSASTQSYEVNDHGEQDLAGVETVSIGTVSADVTVLSGGDKLTADLKGTCGYTTKPVWLDVHREGATLIVKVQYPSSIRYDNTRLTVTIPASYAGNLAIGTVSAGIEATGLPNKLRNVTLGAVSGNTDFSSASYESLTAGSVTGRIALSGIAGQTSANSVSGEVDLDYAVFAPTTVVTVSGGVEAKIPAQAAFRVDFSTTSGDFTSTHAALNITQADHGFKGGTAGAESTIKVNTTSGNFRIEGK